MASQFPSQILLGNVLLLWLLLRFLFLHRPAHRAQQHVNAATHQPRRDLRVADSVHVPDHPLHQLVAKFRMRILASAEEQGYLDLHSFPQKILHVVELGLIIVVVDVDPQLDLFDLARMLMFASFPLALGLLVLELAEFGDPTYGRRRIRRHFHQIHSRLLRQPQRLAGGHDSQLFSLAADHPHFAGANLLIYTDKLLNE